MSFLDVLSKPFIPNEGSGYKDFLSERNVILQIDSSVSDSITVSVSPYDPYTSTTTPTSVSVDSTTSSTSSGGY